MLEFFGISTEAKVEHTAGKIPTSSQVIVQTSGAHTG